MTRSANEVMALAAKAARGAGVPPAQASDFGCAVVSHLCAGRDPAPLRAALTKDPGGALLSLPLQLARLLETAKDGIAEGQIAAVHTSPDLLCSYADALPFAHTLSPLTDGVHLRIDITQPAPRRPVSRVALPDDLAELMQTLAARTFVPESDSSRLSGAGAGLTDND